jgi:hypothetical protein
MFLLGPFLFSPFSFVILVGRWTSLFFFYFSFSQKSMCRVFFGGSGNCWRIVPWENVGPSGMPGATRFPFFGLTDDPSRIYLFFHVVLLEVASG